MWAKMQSSPLVHLPRLKRLQISLPLEACVALSTVVVFGLTGGPKRAVIVTKGQVAASSTRWIIAQAGVWPCTAARLS